MIYNDSLSNAMYFHIAHHHNSLTNHTPEIAVYDSNYLFINLTQLLNSCCYYYICLRN